MQVQADRRLIYRVIYNFASNAVKYSGDKTEAENPNPALSGQRPGGSH